jgi:hypothetical protein
MNHDFQLQEQHNSVVFGLEITIIFYHQLELLLSENSPGSAELRKKFDNKINYLEDNAHYSLANVILLHKISDSEKVGSQLKDRAASYLKKTCSFFIHKQSEIDQK